MAWRPSEASWVKWLERYGAAKFYRAFVATAQDAQGECSLCGEHVYLDIVEGGGVPDWRTEEGDYGCDKSPDTTTKGCGSHVPVGLRHASQR